MGNKVPKIQTWIILVLTSEQGVKLAQRRERAVCFIFILFNLFILTFLLVVYTRKQFHLATKAWSVHSLFHRLYQD